MVGSAAPGAGDSGRERRRRGIGGLSMTVRLLARNDPVSAGAPDYRVSMLAASLCGMQDNEVTAEHDDTRIAPMHRIELNGHILHAAPGATILGAALAQGIDVPNRCRVGGCGTCKCRVMSGQVHQRTDTSYLLTADEISDGVVLACQSEPRSDLVVAVDMPTQHGAVIVSHERLRADLSQLWLQLDDPFYWHAGQHMQVAFDGLPGLSRTFSAANAPNAEGRLRLLIRHIPGGRVGDWLVRTDVSGTRVSVVSPAGDFGWTNGTDPALMIATGSGLAPILAMLDAALADPALARPVTVMFGARTEQDLILVDELQRIADQWPHPFRYLPVLSRADVTWTGERGHLDDVAPIHVDGNTEVWLCGHPDMVDAVRARLTSTTLPPERLHVDRFDAAPPDAAAQHVADEAATWFDTLKFFGFHAIGVFSWLSLLSGGVGITLGLLMVVAAYIVGDAVAGDDLRTPKYKSTRVLTVQLWLALPLLGAIVFVAIWSVLPTDPFGFGAMITSLTGYDVLAARANSGIGAHIAGIILTGLMIGMVGTIPAHELTHRTWDPMSMWIGRWLLAFSGDTAFAIEHVHGHHHHVATPIDPATAPRGRNVFTHIVRSTIAGNVGAYRIEAARLERLNLPFWHPRNQFLRGQLMTLVLLGLATLIGGGAGLLYFIACAAFGKALLEIVNYMEHYGLVREPGTPVMPHHSWNTNKRVSSWTMFHLTRHSHHHAAGEVAYPALRPYPDAPMMPYGYLTTIVVTLIPPLWFALMAPKLREWDTRYANEAERRLAAMAEQRSGQALSQR